MTETQPRVETIITRMRERGQRLTPQRLAIIETLIGSQDHPSVEQIFEHVRVDFPMTSLATVYKTISVLLEMGEILELGYSNDRNRYDGIPHPHPHLVCVRCNSIVDVDIDSSGTSGLAQKIAGETGYQIMSHQFDFFGICPRCQNGGNPVKNHGE